MPRPGPRPYECVRRAWHSDRHRPLRGSIIQQIFRVVHESHSSATKKNKEWQEKLPIVVLKAEEIMYSKANSEAEYMDSETLWNRVKEAIDTIIRREESTETGELLPPCVEAALNLGCVPVKASRSQRHSNPRSYLSPRSQEPCSVPSKVLVNITDEQNAHSPPLQSSSQFNFARPTSMTLPHFASDSNRRITQTNNPTTSSCNFPLSSEKFSPHGNSYSFPMENSNSLNLGSVYPLYYGTNFQLQMSRLGGHIPKSSNRIIVGTPIFPSTAESSEVSFLRNSCLDTNLGNASNRTTQADLRNNHEKAPEVECDLSLRLGLLLDPNLEKCQTRNIDDAGSSSSQEGSRFSDLSHPKHKEFPFFPMMTASEPFELGTSKLNSEDEGRSAGAAVMKRKAPVNIDMEDDQFLWLPGRIKRPGL